MSLLKLVRVETKIDIDEDWAWLSAWLEYVGDTELRLAMLAANVNIVRRYFPYVYLFCNAIDLESLQNDVLCDSYERNMKSMQLKRGIWIGRPLYHGDTTTVVVQIGIGDVLPFVHLLDQDEFGLLCLPSNTTLEHINDVIQNYVDNEQAIKMLLQDDGCIVSIIDMVNFKILSMTDFFEDLM